MSTDIMQYENFVLDSANELKPGWTYSYHTDSYIRVMDDDFNIAIEYIPSTSKWVVEHYTLNILSTNCDLKLAYGDVRKSIYNKSMKLLNFMGRMG